MVKKGDGYRYQILINTTGETFVEILVVDVVQIEAEHHPHPHLHLFFISYLKSNDIDYTMSWMPES